MKVELHCHSSFSDGLLNPIAILRHSEKIGLGAVAITDQDLKASLLLKNIKSKVIFIPAVETKKENHVLCLGIDRMPHGDDVLEVIDSVHDMGGVAILAHPFSFLYKDYDMDYVKKFDAVEVINGLVHHSNNAKAMEMAKRFKVAGVSGSDAKIEKDIGKFACNIPGENLEDILKNITKAKIPKKETNMVEILGSRTKKILKLG